MKQEEKANENWYRNMDEMGQSFRDMASASKQYLNLAMYGITRMILILVESWIDYGIFMVPELRDCMNSHKAMFICLQH